MKVLTLVGSNRAGSYNALLTTLAVSSLPSDAEVSSFDLTTLPYYDEDADAAGELGAAVEEFRTAVADTDLIILASPAYNGAVTALAKNAVDVASRPRGAACIEGKPVLTLSAVWSAEAGTRVIEQLRTAVQIAGGTALEQSFVVAEHATSFNDNGLVDEVVAAELAQTVTDAVAAARG